MRRLGVVTPLALLALAAFFAGWGSAWELRLDAVAAQPWRLLTGHLTHWTADHLAWDWIVFVGLGLMAERQVGRRRVAVVLGAAAVAISLGAPWLTPELVVYRGLSGLDAALFGLLAARCLSNPRLAARLAGVLALVGLGGKVAWETMTGVPVFVFGTEGVFVVPAAHLLGGVVGMVVGIIHRCHLPRPIPRTSRARDASSPFSP